MIHPKDRTTDTSSQAQVESGDRGTGEYNHRPVYLHSLLFDLIPNLLYYSWYCVVFQWLEMYMCARNVTTPCFMQNDTKKLKLICASKMGTGLCNCSKSPQHDSDMQSIAKIEQSIVLNDKKCSQNKKHYPPTPYAKSTLLQQEGQLDFNFASNTSVVSVPNLREIEATPVVYNMSCESYIDCVAIKRMITCVVFYQALDISDYSRLSDYFSTDNYPYLLDDYHHILHHHLGDETKSIKQSRIEFEMIHNMMIRSIHKCKMNTCDKFKRNNRCRERETNNIFNHNDKLLNYYVNTMDTIHCFFVHPFHCGFRLKLSDLDQSRRRRIKRKRSLAPKMRKARRKSEPFADVDDLSQRLLTIREETKSQCDLAADDNTKLYIDEQLGKIKTKLIAKRNQFETIQGSTLATNNRFMNVIPAYIQRQQIQKGLVHPDDNTPKHSKSQATAVFGHRYYYWIYYKDCTERDSGPNEGYNVNDWYIGKKYDRLQGEICNNTIYKLEYDTFKEIVFMANKKMKCGYAKTRQASGLVLDKYGIGYEQCITAKHIQSVLIYTHFNALSQAFRESFKRKSVHETDTDLKIRASEWWNLGKLLRETVDVFGVDMEHSKVSVFYHNMNYKFRFESMILYLALPTSMTIYLEVATLYGHNGDHVDGIMLEMEGNVDALRCFDCSWLSYNGNNGERLFLGGHYALRFKSIRYIASDVNYERFIHAISMFDYAISGGIPHCDSTKNDLEIIAILVNDRKDLAQEGGAGGGEMHRHAEYINDIFYSFCMKQREICISMWNMERYYYWLQMLLFHNKATNKHLCVFSNLCKIFQNCKKICIRYYEYSKCKLSESFFELLLDELERIPKCNQKNLLIELDQVEYEQNILQTFKNKFIAKSWFIQESDSDKVSIFKMSMSVLSSQK
eukprot:734887_1